MCAIAFVGNVHDVFKVTKIVQYIPRVIRMSIKPITGACNGSPAKKNKPMKGVLLPEKHARLDHNGMFDGHKEMENESNGAA
jgi:hypothetical protein